jgi:hypothetical protein
MATLTYWVSECLEDSHIYNVRAKTKKEAEAQKIDRGADRYGEVKKVVIKYKDAFDLMDYVASESFWE